MFFGDEFFEPAFQLRKAVQGHGALGVPLEVFETGRSGLKEAP